MFYLPYKNIGVLLLTNCRQNGEWLFLLQDFQEMVKKIPERMSLMLSPGVNSSTSQTVAPKIRKIFFNPKIFPKVRSI
jgi:hypothetical protein